MMDGETQSEVTVLWYPLGLDPIPSTPHSADCVGNSRPVAQTTSYRWSSRSVPIVFFGSIKTTFAGGRYGSK